MGPNPRPAGKNPSKNNNKNQQKSAYFYPILPHYSGKVVNVAWLLVAVLLIESVELTT